MTNQKTTILDEKQRLSQSKLWELQRRYYEGVGVNAWRQRAVPHVITSNPFIADQYAQLVYAFVRDWEHDIDKDYPVYLIELGTGSGRFSYHFMRHWLERAEHFGDHDMQFKFLLTDFTESNLKFWKTHPLMKEMVSRGIADFALFDATQDTSLTLVNSGDILNVDTLVNPIIVVANYLFDSIPIDIFYTEGNSLSESLVTLESELNADHNHIPELLDSLHLSYHNQPVDGDYYNHTIYNQILEAYRNEFKKTYFRFPIAGLECCVNLQAMSGNRMMLITADKGFTSVDVMDLLDMPQIAVQGSMSMMVNFDAFQRFFTLQKGRWLKTPFQPSDISVQVGLLGQPESGYSEVSLVFHNTISNFGADDYHSLKVALHGNYHDLTIQQMLSIIRMGCWDSDLFEECFEHLLMKVVETTNEIRADVRLVMRQVWEHYYFIGEDNDIPFKVGAILHNIGAFQDAIVLFNYSLQMHGMDPSTLYNLGMSYLYLGDTQQALENITKAADSGQFPQAVETRAKIIATLNQSG